MRVGLYYAITALALGWIPVAGQVKSPSDFFGFPVGADRKLLPWQPIVDYFHHLDLESENVHLLELGRSTGDEPIIVATISSTLNLKNLAKYRNLQVLAADPADKSDEDIHLLTAQSKLIVLLEARAQSVDCSATLATMEIAYRLATASDPVTLDILQHAIIMVVPSDNPDGTTAVYDWYNKYVYTPHEAAPLTRLSHPYAGDEYIYDGIWQNLVESRLFAREIWDKWNPHVVIHLGDATQQAARIKVRKTGPVAKHAEAALLNAIANHLATRDVSGAEVCREPQSFADGSDRLAFQVRVAGLEVATPIHFTPGQAAPSSPALSRDVATTPPWPGGWWRLKNAVDYQASASLAILQTVAESKEDHISTYIRSNLHDSTLAGPWAFAVPQIQRDELLAARLIEILIQNGVRVYRAETAVARVEATVVKGDYIVPTNQPNRRFILSALTSEKELLQAGLSHKAGSLPVQMGVEVQPVMQPIAPLSSQLRSAPKPVKRLKLAVNGDYVMHHRTNRSFLAINRLLHEGKKVYWLKEETVVDGVQYEPGSIVVPAKEMHAEKMDFWARELSFEIRQSRQGFDAIEVYLLEEPRLGLYQSWIPNPDEGWTRLVLEQHDFRYRTVFNSDVRNNRIKGDLDAMILPDMEPGKMLDGWPAGKKGSYKPSVPRSYVNGITETGARNLRDFAFDGGTVIALGRACEFAVRYMDLPVEPLPPDSAIPGEPTQRFLPVSFDITEPVAYGMQRQGWALFTSTTALVPIPWRGRTRVPAYIAPDSPTEAHSTKKGKSVRAVVLDIPIGLGRVILLGPRVQFRAQTPATFKLLLNAVLYSAVKSAVL